MSKPPNFVLVLADDLSLRDVGCYGNGIVRTPHIDSLAREGLRFDAMFTTQAICAPSRSTLYTGLYPVHHGCHMNHGRVQPGTRSLPHYLAPLGYRVGLAGKTHIGPPASFPFEYLRMDEMEKFMSGSQPFCLVIASTEPHPPHQAGEHDPAQMSVPPSLVDTPEMRRNMADYYADIELFDREVGHVLELLKRHALEENTLTLCTSDHGFAWFAKWTLYDAGLNVPFIARWPAVIEPGRTNFALLSFVDVVPTLVEIGGAQAPEVVDGVSFAPLLRGDEFAGHERIFASHTNRGIVSGSTFPIRAVRTRTHKYIRNLQPGGVFENLLTSGTDFNPAHASPVWKSWRTKAAHDAHAAERVLLYRHRPPEELYDLRRDPYEMKNLAAEPDLRTLKNHLGRSLDEWMANQGDRGLETELAVSPHAARIATG